MLKSMCHIRCLYKFYSFRLEIVFQSLCLPPLPTDTLLPEDWTLLVIDLPSPTKRVAGDRDATTRKR